MPRWADNPHTAGKSIPPSIRARTERRISRLRCQALLRKVHQDRCLRFHGALCYIDAYMEPDAPRESAPPSGQTRGEWIEGLGTSETKTSGVSPWYTYADEKYEPTFLLTDEDQGTPEDAFETAAFFL